MSHEPPVLPVNGPPYYYPPQRSRVGLVFLWIFLLGSIVLNFVLCCGGLSLVGINQSGEGPIIINERTLSGPATATDKVAVIRLDGVIMESALGYVHKQIDSAASDNTVKAIVLRVESPGGTITASDDLLRRLSELRDGTVAKYKGKSIAKPIVVSMGSVAASGGYYVSMAAAKDPNQPAQKKLYAERTTITGSIGVYASLPNAKGLSDKVGFRMDMIKAGDIKGSGSPFHDMTPSERQPWQDMVDSSYKQFLEVVETGRPELKGKLTEPLFAPKPVDKYDDRGNKIGGDGGTYTRKLADGGIFMAKEAVEYKLIDAIGTQDDAAVEAASQAKLGEYKVVEYAKPINIWSALAGAAESKADLNVLSHAELSPRIWYMVPSSEVGARVTRR